MMVKAYQMLIDGKWVDSVSGCVFESENPYTGKVWATLPRATPEDVDAAMEAADRAFNGVWAEYTATQRGQLLYKLGELISQNAERLAEIEVQDNGKLLSEMKAQLSYLPKYFYYYAGLADKIEGAVIPSDNKAHFNFTRREPLGVVLAITAWNSPLLFFALKAAPALAAGNTMVVKPSEFTSASMLELAALISQAGFPDGVVNVITGFGGEIGDSLVEHKKTVKIAFTGSDYTGARVSEKAAKNVVPVTMELGGKSANIVFADAEIDNALNGVMAGIFGAGGQTCVAGSRLLVHKSIAGEFIERLVERSSQIRLGDPRDPDTQMGPMSNKPHFEKVNRFFDIAVSDGAHVALGGRPAALGGYFVEPTIYTGVANSMRIAREEVFGPLLAVIEFEEDDEAISIANDCEYGLAAGVWTQDYRRMLRMSKSLRAGTVWANCYRTVSFTTPFGGCKRSGHGRESGMEAINAYLQTKSIWINTAEKVANPFVMAIG
ncbi:aldehyde dehydrogenase [Pseudomonas tolaasii]